MLNFPDLFVLEFNTDSYAGNFERQACAYATGWVGDCGVGQVEADLFFEDIKDEEIIDLFNETMSSNAVFNSDGCNRPTVMSRSETGEYNSFCIFFSEQPSDGIRRLITERVIDYLEPKNVKVFSIECYKLSMKKEMLSLSEVKY